jgi:hypothetical protein
LSKYGLDVRATPKWVLILLISIVIIDFLIAYGAYWLYTTIENKAVFWASFSIVIIFFVTLLIREIKKC